MKSLTKVELTADQLLAAVQAAFGPGVNLTESEEFHDGWFNTIHGLTLSDGRRVVLKTAPKPGVPVLRHEENLLDTEVTVYRLLASKGVNVPLVHFYEPSGSVLGLPYFVMDRIDLPTYGKVKETLTGVQRASVERGLGRLNAQINAVVGPAFGSVRQEGFQSPRWSEAFLHLFDGTLADGAVAGTVLPIPASDLRAAVVDRAADLDAVTEPRLVHWDLHDGNVFVEGDQAKYLIDADRCQWADPLMEIYYAPFFDQTHFVLGYGTDLRQTPGALVRRRLYDLHLGVVMVVESDYRGFDEGHKAWTRGFLLDAWKALTSIS